MYVSNKMKNISVTTILENSCMMFKVLAQHWVSFLVKYWDNQYLFDCWQIFGWLNNNLEVFNINPKKLTWIIISHDHYDHCACLSECIKKFDRKNVIVPSDFKRASWKEIKKISKPYEIEKWLWTTGSLNWKGIKEQSLIIDLWKKWLVIIVWCSHPGIKNIVERAKIITKNNKILWIIWWLHLADSSQKTIDSAWNYLKSLNTKFICPGHCTWTKAIFTLQQLMPKELKVWISWSIWVGNRVKISPNLKIESKNYYPFDANKEE